MSYFSYMGYVFYLLSFFDSVKRARGPFNIKSTNLFDQVIYYIVRKLSFEFYLNRFTYLIE
ncbi:hypothetical protein PEC301877_02320 [Pectobacterium carotovorum subsp. carotovorum]|nr:hypothetical protein PEC301877_02320 [Pectobacterium carotovorum subsp. carotovorum]